MLAGGPFANAAIGSYSTITADATARTPSSNFSFGGDINYRKLFGPGAEGAATESMNEGVRARYERSENTGKEYIYGSWRRQNTQLALLSQLGILAPVTGNVDVTTIGGGIDRSINSLDTISLSARAALTSYDPASAGTAFTDTNANATWRHRVNQQMSLIATSDFEWEDFNNATNTRLMLLRETAGVEATLSPLLSFRGTAGFIYGKGEGGGSSTLLPLSTSSPTIGATGATSDSALGFIGNADLTYRMLKNTTVTLLASQSISPTVVGSLTKNSTVGAGLSQTINSRSSVSFNTSLSQSTSSGGTSDFLSASVAYSYALARQWQAQLSYRYLHRFASTGSVASNLVIDPITGIPLITPSSNGAANSSSIIVVVSHSVSMLPDGYEFATLADPPNAYSKLSLHRRSDVCLEHRTIRFERKR